MSANAAVERRKPGSTGPRAFPIALGCIGVSGTYGATDDAESIATIHAAIDAGVNLLNTGDFYARTATKYCLAVLFAFNVTRCCSL